MYINIYYFLNPETLQPLGDLSESYKDSYTYTVSGIKVVQGGDLSKIILNCQIFLFNQLFN